MLSEAQARAVAEENIAAWNSHDLERILAHYSDDVVLVSPLAANLLGEPSGEVRGKAALRAYFARGLAAFPELRFELADVMWGVSSVVLYYKNQRGTMTGEVLELAPDGRIHRVLANYSSR
ncbi:MAG TPA: nuclear transport factor 2 family protein [Polyangiaceae bacterium]|jgi:hypothetical protein|nr:nuclear transport factor 2 family protein [Polyangiaceae bacterium]